MPPSVQIPVRDMSAMEALRSHGALARAAGMDIRGNAVFSRHGRAVLLIPVRDGELASNTIGLYQPQTPRARLAARGLRFLNRSGALRILPRVPGVADAPCGVLLCNPDHGTRLLAVRRTASGATEVVKAAAPDCAAPLVDEHAVLRRLRGRAGVPEVGDLHRDAGATWFSMDLLGSPGAKPDMGELLRAWTEEDREPALANGLVRDLLPYLDDSIREALDGLSVRRALVHGDFAPWNWRADADGNLVCIDWEWAREDGFAGFDLVYGLAQQALLVRKVKPARLSACVSKAASRLSGETQACLRDAGLSVDILLALVGAYRKAKGMDGAPASPPCSLPQSIAAYAPRPSFIAFEGADGVGKSTVMRRVVPEFVRRGGFRGYLFFHWKPVAGELSRDAIPGDDPHDPRQKRPRCVPASVLFLAYHWLGFQIGYWRRLRPAMREGLLVVADRYSYDVLLDPARFRLRLPDWVLRMFVRTIPRPARAILLHAPASVIRARKPELSFPEIETYQRKMLASGLIRNPVPADASGTPSAIAEGLLEALLPFRPSMAQADASAGNASRSLCVLVVHNHYRVRGGEDSVFESECRMLEEAGHRVVRYEKTNDDISDRGGGLAKLGLALRTVWNPRTVREVRALIRAESPAIVHCHNTFPLISPSIYFAAAREGVPVVQTLHNYRLACLDGYLFREGRICEACLGRFPWRGVCRRCYRKSFAQSATLAAMLLVHRLLGTWRRKVTRYIALTEFARDKFVQAGLPASRIVVKPNAFVAGPDAPTMDSPFPGRLEPRETENPAVPPRVIYVGRLSSEKGVDVLLRAWALLLKSGSKAVASSADFKVGQAKLTIVGDGPERAALESLSATLGIADRVVFTGALPRVAALVELSTASLLVLPTLCYETFGLGVLEAASQGIPALVTNIGGQSCLVQDGVSGKQVPPDNPQALATALCDLLADPERLRRMGAAARAAFESSDCLPVRNSARLERIYASCLPHDA